VATCPSGHASASDDFCDVCGVLIGAAPSLAAEGPGTVAGPASAAGPDGPGGQPPASAEPCPRCGSSRTGQFCESCGYDFAAAVPAAPLSATPLSPAAPVPSPDSLLSPAPAPAPAPAPSSATLPGSPAPPPVPSAPVLPVLPRPVSPGPVSPGPVSPGLTPAAGATSSAAPVPGQPSSPGPGWTAVVTADRAYFDSVQTASGPDAEGITFPVYCPQRRFPLTGTEMRIGRRSARTGINPEIDLTGPPADPGVSRLHAVLLRAADGSWSLIDPGSANGTLVNGSEIPRDQVVPVSAGDRIYVGAWTAISILHED
jgi:hypothetical protein